MHSSQTIRLFLFTLIGFCLSLLTAPPVHADYLAGAQAFAAKDYKTARQEWQPLAEAGNAEAQIGMGVLSECTCDRPANMSTAIKWYKKAADQGSSMGQLYLGNLYLQGKAEGFTQDPRKAAKFFDLAARQGDHNAQNMLGFLHATGKGVPRDSTLSLMWFKLAEQGGNKKASGNVRKESAKLSVAERSTATKLARQCRQSSYRNCGRP